MPVELRQFLCATDNFGVLLHDPATGATAAIDACEEGPIVAALDAAGWTLSHILVTHHHADHTAALPALKARYGARAIGPRHERDSIAGLDATVGDGDTVEVGGLRGVVIDTPGHTSGHIAFHFAAERLLFAGDTLFSLGCGRILEGTPAQMWASLGKLAALPDDTVVYCGHEYTLSNARFALGVDAANPALQERAREVELLREENRFTLPTSIGREKATNPFLRAGLPEIAAAVGMAGKPAEAVFAELRERKNRG